MSLISAENLEFGYVPGKPVLRLPKLTVEKGENVFLYGPSGHGKSTLLNLLSGVLAPNNGTLNVLGFAFDSLKQSQRDRIRGEKIGYIFQSFNLLPYLSVKENILLPVKVSIERRRRLQVDEQAEAFRLAEELGLASYINSPVTDLSIGQQQRVAAARALMGSPELIIADEPTSSLDEENTSFFMDLLLKEKQNESFTLIFVSHDRRLGRYFDRAIDLSEINEIKSSRNSDD